MSTPENSGYIGVDKRDAKAGIYGLRKHYLERLGGKFAIPEDPPAPPEGGYHLDGTYTLDIAPIMHFDAANMEGGDATTRNGNGGWANDDAVTTWKDRSGNATSMDAAQGTVTSKPTFKTGGGDPYVYFDGGDWLEIANGPLLDTQTSGITMIMLIKRSASGKSLIGIGNDGSAGVLLLPRGWTGVLTYMGGVTGNTYVNQSGAGLVDNFNDLNMHTFTKSTGGDEDTNTKWYYGGGTTSFDNSVMSAPTARADTLTMKVNRVGVAYGAGDSTTAYYLDGDLYETMLFTSELSTDDLNTIKDYLAAKWATPLAASSNTLGDFS